MSALDPGKYLRRFFGSEWTRVFGPAFVVYLVLTVGAAAYTGNWDLPWLFALVIALILFRFAFIVFLGLFPVWIAIVVAWAAYRLFHKKKPRKETNETSSNNEPRGTSPASTGH